MKIINNKLKNVRFIETPNVSNKIIDPTVIVVHYTANYSLKQTVDWFKNPDAKVSAHLIIDRDGSMVQMADFKTKCWHCGKSKWKGLKNLNNHAIGIELVNIGYTKCEPYRGFIDSYGNEIPKDIPVLELLRYNAEYKHLPKGFSWLTYTEVQIKTLYKVIKSLLKKYPDIQDIVGHDEISKLKTDPGPMLRMDIVRKNFNK